LNQRRFKHVFTPAHQGDVSQRLDSRMPRVAFAAQTAELLHLARDREPEARERLLEGIITLCDSAADVIDSESIQSLLGAIFIRLVAEAERDIRLRLSEKLANAAWAPPALVNVLALDEIEIAAPIIALSPVLRDHDLIRILVESTLDHQVAVARRGRISSTVVEAILQQDEPAVLTALAANDSALISEAGMSRLVESSRRVAALRSPLARHPRLSSDMAQRLYLWVGQSLRAPLIERFRLDPTALDAALADSVREAHSAPGAVEALSRAAKAEVENEARLVTKLHEAGQLRPGFLLRMLRERKLGIFVAALARLGGFQPDHIQRAIDSDRPELLALACVAVGIDRSVFPAILDSVRELNGAKPGGGPDALRRANGAFGPFEPDIAGMAFRQAIASV
jgi:uncharacterized protein (DUF2336 family)